MRVSLGPFRLLRQCLTHSSGSDVFKSFCMFMNSGKRDFGLLHKVLLPKSMRPHHALAFITPDSG
jgi:hypothetical protein